MACKCARGVTTMPRAAISESELAALLTAILNEGGRANAERLLETQHQYTSSLDPTGDYLMPHEKYFKKLYAYEDFELHVHYFTCEGDTVTGCDLQFKRPSRFPAPLLNRNRSLVRKLTKQLKAHYGEHGIEVKDPLKETEMRGRQLHFRVDSPNHMWYASTPFEDWMSECSLYDEPYSSGRTDPSETDVRNDFVILRFRRKSQA
jgi:hypothetical protein